MKPTNDSKRVSNLPVSETVYIIIVKSVAMETVLQRFLIQ